MKQFLQKNIGYLIAAGMILGGATFFIGLDWDQSQLTWKAAASNTLMWVGGLLFGGSFFLLVSKS